MFHKIACKVSKYFKKRDLYYNHVCYFVNGTSKDLVPTSSRLKPIDMSYVSYESTVTQEGNSAPPPVIIMHGLMGSKANWNSICKALHSKTQPQRKIIAVDARNHGDSPHSVNHTYEHLVEDIKTLLEKLQINKAVLLGHSMGGRATMYCALKYPEIVDRLIVVDISPISVSPNLKTMPIFFRAMERVSIDNNVPMSTARQQADLQLSKLIKDPAIRQFLITNLVKQENGKYTWRINLRIIEKNFIRHIANFPLMHNKKYEGSTLFIGGGKSDYIPTNDHEGIIKLFPKSEFQYVPEAGHLVHTEQPDYFLKLTLEFLNRAI